MYKFNRETVWKGRKATLAFFYLDDQGNQLNLSGNTGTVMRIENHDGSFIEKAATAGFVWGAFEQTTMQTFEFSSAETALFKLGAQISIWIKVSFGSAVQKYEIAKFLTVKDEVY